MMTVDDVRRFCSGKEVYLWGAMIVGQGVCRALERIGVPITSFVDRSSSLQGKRALGYEIDKPENVFEKVKEGKGIIIATSGHCDLEIGKSCEEAGFVKGRDFILCRELNDIDPSVEVAGMCNLHCISCPRGNETNHPPAGLMTPETYRKVLDKLLREIPLLGSIQLYTWGEPLLNPRLAEIVALTREAKVLTAISSNLNYARNLDQVIAAKPDWFKVSCSGWENSYETTHTGGTWSVFLKNLRHLAECRRLYHPEMQITVNYHLYKNNLGDDYRRMEDLCRELDLIFRPSPAYLYPADAIMEYVDGKPLSEAANRTIPLLMMGLDEGIAKARERASQPCPEERCFPINWDCRVRACGVYYRPFIAENFLETPLTEIMERKRTSQLCRECKKRGIHQFTGVYLAEKRVERPSGSKT